MNCPICETELTDAAHEGVEVKCCPEDHGIWLDEGELRTIVDSLDTARSAKEKAAAIAHGGKNDIGDPTAGEVRSCPICHEEMERVEYDEYSGIYIDSCLEDGVWLDTSELERIEAWIEANADELAPVRATIDAGLKRQDQLTAINPIRHFAEFMSIRRETI
jgi:Zn-finger nucleic acid-binding protein